MKELVTIQSRLKAPKSKYNSFAKYNYRSCEDILEAVKPLLAETGCSLTISDTVSDYEGHLFVKATATLTNSENETVSTQAYAEIPASQGGMTASQITGSTSSYARKYALNGLFAIDDTKDDDDLNTYGKKEEKPTTTKKTTTKKRDILAEPLKDTTGVLKEPNLIDAYNDINSCKTSEDLIGVWEKYKGTSVGKDENFRNAIKLSPLNPNKK